MKRNLLRKILQFQKQNHITQTIKKNVFIFLMMHLIANIAFNHFKC